MNAVSLTANAARQGTNAHIVVSLAGWSAYPAFDAAYCEALALE
jgi:hypothetical protein